MCMGFVQSYAALVGVRFLLGVFEAGVGPGSIYLITMYYRRYELPWRLSWWYCSGETSQMSLHSIEIDGSPASQASSLVPSEGCWLTQSLTWMACKVSVGGDGSSFWKAY